MKRLLCQVLPTQKLNGTLSEDETQHAAKVLRIPSGSEVLVIDGKGSEVLARITFKGKHSSLEFIKVTRTDPPSRSPSLVLEAAVLKGDAMSWLIEKAVELGATRFVPILADRSVVQTRNKGEEAFLSRWQRIADQSLKQCGRLSQLEIAPIVTLKELLGSEPRSESTLRFWFDESLSGQTPFVWTGVAQDRIRQKTKAFHLLIGPEGGWSEEERSYLKSQSGIDPNLISSTLGPLVLRAETAGIFALSALRALTLASS